MVGRNPIDTAPRDCAVIIGDDDVGEFVMRWNPQATNAVFYPGVVGMWEALDKSITWSDASGYGPTYWRHLNS